MKITIDRVASFVFRINEELFNPKNWCVSQSHDKITRILSTSVPFIEKGVDDSQFLFIHNDVVKISEKSNFELVDLNDKMPPFKTTTLSGGEAGEKAIQFMKILRFKEEPLVYMNKWRTSVLVWRLKKNIKEVRISLEESAEREQIILKQLLEFPRTLIDIAASMGKGEELAAAFGADGRFVIVKKQLSKEEVPIK